MKLLKNLGYYTPLLGKIVLHDLVPKDGQMFAIPKDHYQIVDLAISNEGYVKNPLQDTILAKKGVAQLTSIPVKVVYNNPQLSVTEQYEAYNRDQFCLMCVGNGEKAMRKLDDGTVKEVDCVGNQRCEFGFQNKCAMVSRTFLSVEGQADQGAAFMLKIVGYNGLVTLRTRIEGLAARFGEMLRHIPLNLVIRSKTSPLSNDARFYYPDLVVDGDESELALLASEKVKLEKERGLNYAEFEKRMIEFQSNSWAYFEDSFQQLEPVTKHEVNQGINSKLTDDRKVNQEKKLALHE